MTKEENAIHWLDWVTEEIKESGKIPMMADWDAIYWILNERKLIDLDTDAKEIFMENTKFDIGFVRVDFKKNTLPEDQYPITFEVKIYAEDGDVYIEFDPDVEDFFKDVIIHVSAFEGFIFDVALEEYIYVYIPTQVLKIPHFSRWCFAW